MNARDLERGTRFLQFGYGLGGIFRNIGRVIRPALKEAEGIGTAVGVKLAENLIQDLIAGKSSKASVKALGSQARDMAVQSAIQSALQRHQQGGDKPPPKVQPAPKRKRAQSKSQPPAKRKRAAKSEQIGGWYSYQHDLKHGNLKEYKKHGSKKRKVPRKQSGAGKQTGGGKKRGKRVKKQSGSGKKRGKRTKKQSGSGKKRGKRGPKTEDVFGVVTHSKKQRGGRQRGKSVWYGNRTTPPWWY